MNLLKTSSNHFKRKNLWKKYFTLFSTSQSETADYSLRIMDYGLQAMGDGPQLSRHGSTSTDLEDQHCNTTRSRQSTIA